MKTITIGGLSFPSRTVKNNDFFLTLPSLNVGSITLPAAAAGGGTSAAANGRVANSNLSVRMGNQEQSIAGHEQPPSGQQLLVGETGGGRVKHRSSSRREGSHQNWPKFAYMQGGHEIKYPTYVIFSSGRFFSDFLKSFVQHCFIFRFCVRGC
jgi:hypothetical protein